MNILLIPFLTEYGHLSLIHFILTFPLNLPFDVCSCEIKSRFPLDSQTKHEEHILNSLVTSWHILVTFRKSEWFRKIPIGVWVSLTRCRKVTTEQFKEENEQVRLGCKHTSRHDSSKTFPIKENKNFLYCESQNFSNKYTIIAPSFSQADSVHFSLSVTRFCFYVN